MGEGARGSDVEVRNPELPPQRDAWGETTFPSRQCDLTPRGAAFPSGPPPLGWLAPPHPRRPSTTHARREPAPCWVRLKARAGVALRCDGGGCCERAEPEARRWLTGMLCGVSRRATGLGVRRAVVRSVRFYFSLVWTLVGEFGPRKRGRGSEGRPVL